MYFVTYGKEYLHDPRVEGCMLLDLSLDCEENSCGYCDFTIYPDHPMYNRIKERDSANQVTVYDGAVNDDSIIFSGFIYELGKEFYMDGHVKCKGELDYLGESIVRPYSTEQRGFGDLAPVAVTEYFEWLILQHNKQVDGTKQFKVGINSPCMFESTNQMTATTDDYPSTITELCDRLLYGDLFSGFVRIRHVGDIRYIDLLPEWTDKNSQILDFGVNLTDYTQTDSAEELYTFVVPLGARLSNTYYDHDDGFATSRDSILDPDKVYFIKNEGTFDECVDLVEFESGITYYEYHGYSETSDTVVDQSKTYYTYEDNKFKECYNLTEFEAGINYYIYNGYSETDDTIVDTTKTYYVCASNNYSECVDLTGFIAGTQYYEYHEENDESDQLLTIEGYNDLTEADSDYNKVVDIMYCVSSQKRYGWIGTVYSNSEITTKRDLMLAGILALKNYVSLKRTIEIKAVDMHLINPSIKPIKVGEYVRVRSAPHNLDEYFLCRNITLDLNNPENSVYTLGETYETLTSQQNTRINALSTKVNKQSDATTIIEQATTKVNTAVTVAVGVQVLAYGNCNTLTETGKYYIGTMGQNKPCAYNGWLEVMKFGTENCFQRYSSYLGAVYERVLNAGTWSSWGRQYRQYVLFNNDSYALDYPVTLSDTAANYDRLTIMYRTNDNAFASIDIWNPNGKLATLTASIFSSTGDMYIKSRTVYISGTSITTNDVSGNYLTGEVICNGSNAATLVDHIGISQVIGWR